MFTVEHYGVEPDIIIMGKALGGDLPFSAVMMRRDLTKDLDPISHVLTAAGNSMSCAVACKNIDLIKGELLKRSTELGAYTIGRLKEKAEKLNIIGDVRGMGLGIAVELVRDRETKEPLSSGEMIRALWMLRDNGVFVLPCGRHSYYWNRVIKSQQMAD